MANIYGQQNRTIGDINDDGEINVIDVVLLVSNILDDDCLGLNKVNDAIRAVLISSSIVIFNNLEVPAVLSRATHAEPLQYSILDRAVLELVPNAITTPVYL